jgi:hypothetical protein
MIKVPNWKERLKYITNWASNLSSMKIGCLKTPLNIVSVIAILSQEARARKLWHLSNHKVNKN